MNEEGASKMVELAVANYDLRKPAWKLIEEAASQGRYSVLVYINRTTAAVFEQRGFRVVTVTPNDTRSTDDRRSWWSVEWDFL